jgi:hypothetical protein
MVTCWKPLEARPTALAYGKADEREERGKRKGRKEEDRGRGSGRNQRLLWSTGQRERMKTTGAESTGRLVGKEESGNETHQSSDSSTNDTDVESRAEGSAREKGGGHIAGH